MQLELYKAFYHTAQHGSISKASEYLYITQPAVSRAIKQLEDALNCRLFFRTSKGVGLTPEGEVLYQYVEQAFNALVLGEKKLGDMKNLLTGDVKIGVSDTLCKHYLIPYLKMFNVLYPSIKIHVVCPTTPGIISLIKAGKIDFGIINLPYEDEQIHFHTIMPVQDCFVTGYKYRHLAITHQPLNVILNHPLLLLEHQSNSRTFIEEYFKSNGCKAAPAFELGNMDLLIHFAKFDFGIACVIRNFVEDDLESGALYEIKPIEKIPVRHIGAAWLRNDFLSPAARVLIRNLENREISDI